MPGPTNFSPLANLPDVHVLPEVVKAYKNVIYDWGKEHEQTRTCWCSPIVKLADDKQSILLIHKSE